MLTNTASLDLTMFVELVFSAFVTCPSPRNAAPPKIVACSPKSLHHRQGEIITLFCNASGNPEPTLTWTKDGKPLQSSLGVSVDGYKVLVRNLQREHAGVYMATFSNNVGSVSQLINLVVEGAAYIMTPPENMTAIEGQRIQFQCDAVAFPSNITTFWFKNKINVKFLPGYGSRISTFPDGSLVIGNVFKDDMGWYTCHPTNGIGDDPEASAYLNVTYLPKVLHMPNRLYWARGFQQQLDCNVDANPPVVKTMWTKNGLKLHFSSNRLKLLGNGTVVVSDVEITDAGSYSCLPFSSLGSGPSSPLVQIIVRDPPYFTIRPNSNYQAQATQSVTIPCEADGSPNPDVTWRKVGGRIRWGSRAVQHGGNLTISKVKKEDHGDYECVATNEITSIVIGTRLIIERTTPHAPYNVTVETSLFSARVQWMPAYDGGSEQHYIIWFRSTGNLDNNWQTIRVPPGDKTSFTVYNLEPDTVYEFMVLSRNSLGDGMFSERVLAKTLGYQEGLPTGLPTKASGATYIPPIVRPIGPRPLPPVNITVSLQSKGLNISWYPPLNSSISVLYYVIEYRNSTKWKRLEEVVLAPKIWYLLKGLKPGIYQFQIFAFSLLSFSLPAQSEKINVPEGLEDEDDTSGQTGASFSALPVPAIGGIVGGLAFLLIAVILAIIAVVISKKKQKKKAKKYGNVKYFEPEQIEADRNKTASEWDSREQNGGRNLVRHSNTDSIFVVPQPGYNKCGSAKSSLPPRRQHSVNHEFYGSYKRRSIITHHAVCPIAKKTYSPSSHLIWHDIGNKSSPLDSSVQQVITHADIHKEDSPTFTQQHRVDMRVGMASVHVCRDSHNTRHHCYWRPSTRGGLDNPYIVPVQAPLVAPFRYSEAHRSSQVTSPNPHVANVSRLSRHDSFRPSQNTCLTSSPDDQGSSHPLRISDISSVQPSSFSERSDQCPVYRNSSNSYTKTHLDSCGELSREFGRAVPFGSLYMQTQWNNFYSKSPCGDFQVAIPFIDEFLEEKQHPDYVEHTPEHLQGVADPVRRAPHSRKQQGASKAAEFNNNTSLSTASNSRIHHHHYQQQRQHHFSPRKIPPGYMVTEPHAKHELFCRNKLKYVDNDLYKDATDSRTSVSSSGRGSIIGHAKFPDSHLHHERLPDSYSSGLGSRSTSQSVPSSFQGKTPRGSASVGSITFPREYDTSLDSSAFLNGSSLPRRDISGDENYEFDSIGPCKRESLGVPGKHEPVKNTRVLSTAHLHHGLYPQPRKPSRYSNSDKRFERLREEYYQYRRSQQRYLLQQTRLFAMDSEML